MKSYPTIESYVGNTPLVRLQRMNGASSNTILLKLEGNNPAGSVKDRPALRHSAMLPAVFIPSEENSPSGALSA